MKLPNLESELTGQGQASFQDRLRSRAAYLLTRLPESFAPTVLDQVLISALNLLVGLLFVVSAPKVEYGLYALAFSGLMLLGSIQNAAILTPLSTDGVLVEGVKRDRFLSGLFRFQTYTGLVLAVAAGSAAFAIARGQDPPVFLGVAVVVAVMGYWCREFRRSERFLAGQLKRLILEDGATVGAASLGVAAVVWFSGSITAAWALLIVGTLGIATGWRGRTGVTEPGGEPGLTRIALDLLPQARWTLPWTLLAWLQGSSFPYIVTITSGAESVAEVAAARLPAAPLALIGAGLIRPLLPNAGRAMLSGGHHGLWTLAKKSAVLVVLLNLGYFGLLMGLQAVGGSKVWPQGYSHVSGLVTLWCLYFLAATVRGVGSTVLLAQGAFRAVFALTAASLALATAAMVCLGLNWGPPGVLVGMVTGEVALNVLVWITLGKRGAISVNQLEARG